MDENTTTDAPLDPAGMLALVRQQQRDIGLQLGGAVPYILLAWGVSWTLGFLSLWSVDGLPTGLPLGAAVPVFVVLFVAAGGVSAFLGIRSGRGIRSSPDSAFTGTVYGVTWSIGFLGLTAIGIALIQWGLGDLANLYFASVYVFFCGIMYIIAAAIWHAIPALVAGCWLVLVAATAPFFGYPGNYLVLAIAGGGAFLVMAVALLFFRAADHRAHV